MIFWISSSVRIPLSWTVFLGSTIALKLKAESTRPRDCAQLMGVLECVDVTLDHVTRFASPSELAHKGFDLGDVNFLGPSLTL